MRIFISYAHVDWQFVKSLAERLRRYHDVWYDDRLHAGQDWWETILQRLDWCECFIYVLTPESLASEYCLKEYEEARRLKRQIVPVRMQPNISLPDALGRIQYADFAERLFEDAMIDLIGDLGRLELSLRAQLPKAEPQAPPPTPAPLEESPGKPINPAELYRDAVKAYHANDFEAALRLAYTLIVGVPKFLPGKVEDLVFSAEEALEAEARRKEYLREYQQVLLLAREEFTLGAARQLWTKLREDYPDIDHDPDNLTAYFIHRMDDVLPPPFEWIEIPAGQVTIEEGIEESSIPEGYRGTYLLERFMIARYPVTGAQYQVFADAEDGYRDARWWT
jgi:hypothetical protein